MNFCMSFLFQPTDNKDQVVPEPSKDVSNEDDIMSSNNHQDKLVEDSPILNLTPKNDIMEQHEDNMVPEDNCPGINVILATPNAKTDHLNEDQQQQEILAQAADDFVQDTKAATEDLVEAVNDFSDKAHEEINKEEELVQASDDLMNSAAPAVADFADQFSMNNGDDKITATVDSLVEAVNDLSDKVETDLNQKSEDLLSGVLVKPDEDPLAQAENVVGMATNELEEKLNLNKVDETNVSVFLFLCVLK